MGLVNKPVAKELIQKAGAVVLPIIGQWMSKKWKASFGIHRTDEKGNPRSIRLKIQRGNEEKIVEISTEDIMFNKGEEIRKIILEAEFKIPDPSKEEDDEDSKTLEHTENLDNDDLEDFKEPVDEEPVDSEKMEPSFFNKLVRKAESFLDPKPAEKEKEKNEQKTDDDAGPEVPEH